MARWHCADTKKPPVDSTDESDYLLCLGEFDITMFVGWYNARQDVWRVAHWKADDLPVLVTHWSKLPKKPEL